MDNESLDLKLDDRLFQTIGAASEQIWDSVTKTVHFSRTPLNNTDYSFKKINYISYFYYKCYTCN